MTDLTVNIRSIQHYMYCPRRYGLLELNKDWGENYFVANADILHEHVHDKSHNFTDSKKIVRSAVALYNDVDEYDLYGVADCIEFIRSDTGVEIGELCGKYNVKIVEYKPSSPRGTPFRDTDAIQVFAQKICADYIWGCDSEAFLYYSDTRKRVALPFSEEFEKYDTLLKKLLSEMREVMSKNQIPPRRRGQKCSGCSVKDVCFPKDKRFCVREEIMSMKRDCDI